MRKCLLCLVGASFAIPHVFCQYYFYDANHLEPEWRIETGVSIGLMNCLTDLGGKKGNGRKFLQDVNWKLSRPVGGLYLSITYHDYLGIRMSFIQGSVTANDSVLKGKNYPASLRYNRNLHFRSKIAEWNAVMEFHPLYLQQSKSPNVSPYLSLGFGYFCFEPEAYLDGSWISLQPLHTEGQGFREYPKRVEYKTRQGNIPLGLGAKYDLSNLLVCRIEFEYRILFTDYLDDVSQNYIDPSLFYKYFPDQKAVLAQRLADRSGEIDPSRQTKPEAMRGNAGNKDTYFSFTMKLGFILNRKRI
jgi:Domain of unknown function (DUF6089)